MGIVQKDAFKTTVISYLGLFLGYVNKVVLFIWFLSTEQIGLINLILAVGLLFAQLSNLGTVYVTWRFFPFFRNAARKHYGFLLLNTLVVCFGILLFTLLFYFFQGTISNHFNSKSPLFVQYYYWIIPLGIANVFFMLFENHLRGLFQNVFTVFLQDIALRIGVTCLLLMLAFNSISFELFFILHVLIYFIPGLVSFVYLLKIGEFHFSIKSITIPKRFRKIMVYFSLFSYLNTLTTLLVISMDALMIASYLDLRQTGIYTTMINLTSALQIPYRAIVRVSSPIIAKLWKAKDMIGMQEIYEKSSAVGLFIGLLSFLCIWTCRLEFFSFLKPEFSAGMYVLFFLLIGRMVDMYCGLNGTIFSTSKKYKFDLFFTVFLCLGIFVLNLYVIPKYGIVGAAFATGLVYVIYNFARTFYIYKVYGLLPFKRSQLKLVILFFLVFALIEGISLSIPADWLLEKSISLFLIFIKCSLVIGLFVLPVIYFKMEPETANYFNKLRSQWRMKKMNSLNK
jgi:O-antigen/teichoic acid export membrane protein